MIKFESFKINGQETPAYLPVYLNELSFEESMDGRFENFNASICIPYLSGIITSGAPADHITQYNTGEVVKPVRFIPAQETAKLYKKDGTKRTPASVMFFSDGTSVSVKCAEGTEYNEYNAFCACLAKKMFGNNTRLKKVIDEIREIPMTESEKRRAAAEEANDAAARRQQEYDKSVERMARRKAKEMLAKQRAKQILEEEEAKSGEGWF